MNLRIWDQDVRNNLKKYFAWIKPFEWWFVKGDIKQKRNNVKRYVLGTGEAEDGPYDEPWR